MSLRMSLLDIYICNVLILGGAGGKGTWGKPGEVYDDVDMVNDEQDPNYDSEEAEVQIVKSSKFVICANFKIIQFLKVGTYFIIIGTIP